MDVVYPSTDERQRLYQRRHGSVPLYGRQSLAERSFPDEAPAMTLPSRRPNERATAINDAMDASVSPVHPTQLKVVDALEVRIAKRR